MYRLCRGIALLTVAITVAFAVAGAALAVELNIGLDRVEYLEIVLNGLGLLFLFIVGAVGYFVRWVRKQWGPNELDPITLLMMERLVKHTSLQPLIERLEAIETTQKKMADHIALRRAETKVDDLPPLR